MHTSNPSSNRIAKVLVALASIVVALGLIAASSSAAYAATGNQKPDEKRLASQSSDSEGPLSSDRASTEYGLIGKGGYLYPADAQGDKVADTWADRTFNTKAITKLFVASDATSIPGPLFVPKTEKSGSMQDIMSFTNLGDVTFLLDDNGRNACKSIGASAFAYSSVSTLTNFEKTRVEVIDKQAFSNSQLVSISLPPTLKRIGPGAFSASRWLESLSGLGKTKLTSIGDGSFESCTSLKSVILPDSCTTIGSAAFRFPNGEVPSLISVVGGRKLKAIQSEAFSGCLTLESVKLRSSGVKVGSRAFASCSALRAFPFSKVASIGEGAFQYDVSLKGSLVISRDCESIGCAAFADCALLRRVILPNTLKKIDNGTYLC